MGRSPCCDKLGLKKGPWTPEEDQKLLAYIEEHGHGNWRALPAKAGLQRCGKSCRLRWTNYLRPDIKRGKFSLEEEQTIIQLHALLGNRWSAIATHLPRRTDNEIKNYWNTHLKKRLTKMGIDPVTHKPKNDGLLSTGDGAQQTKNAANLSHMAQWERARLEAEARLVRQSKLHSGPSSFTTHQPINNFDINSINSTNSDSSKGTSIMPRCLDVLKVWNNVWQPSSSNSATTPMVGIGPGGFRSTVIGGGLGIESPTSTLSFSENGPLVPTVGATSSTAVIEFMEHSKGQNENRSDNSQVEQRLVKEERVQEWKTRFDYHNGSHNQYHYHNRHDHHGVTITKEHSLSFSASSGLNDIMESNNNDKSNDDEVDDGDDDDNDNDNGHDHQSFMEGFTELLLGAATATNNTSGEKSQTEVDERRAQTGSNNNSNNNDNYNNNGRGCTSSSSCGDYYEDNKNYWNSILNLVNSSPSHSPMF